MLRPGPCWRPTDLQGRPFQNFSWGLGVDRSFPPPFHRETWALRLYHTRHLSESGETAFFLFPPVSRRFETGATIPLFFLVYLPCQKRFKNQVPGDPKITTGSKLFLLIVTSVYFGPNPSKRRYESSHRHLPTSSPLPHPSPNHSQVWFKIRTRIRYIFRRGGGREGSVQLPAFRLDRPLGTAIRGGE